MYEIFIAELTDTSVDSFFESDTLIAYVKESDFDQELQNAISQLCARYDTDYDLDKLPEKNWNALWESNFEKVEIDDFVCVRAAFHDYNPLVLYDIIIDPKMAFGTGHHETTYMMLESMRQIDCREKSVLDYGCGTGVLAILAEKLGAHSITAIDYDIHSFNNTVEHLQLNNCTKVNALHGEIGMIKGKSFDLILANINRSVLIQNVDVIITMLEENGNLLLSGVLAEDADLVLEVYKDLGFHLVSDKRKGEWCCFHLTNSTNS